MISQVCISLLSVGDNYVPVNFVHLPQRMQCIGGGGGGVNFASPPIMHALWKMGRIQWCTCNSGTQQANLMPSHLNKYLIQYILGENQGSSNH